MFGTYDINDNRDDRRARDLEDDVRDILRRRRRHTGHAVYGLIASAVGSCTLLVWGSIYSDVRHDAHGPLTQGYAAFLSFAIVLGFAAVAVGCTWANIRENRKRAADEDRIMEYVNEQLAERDERQARQIVDKVLEGLRDEERKRYIKAVADELRDEADGPASCGRSDDRASVILLDRPRRGQRGS